MSDLPTTCPCGRCIREPLALPALAARLADEWVAFEVDTARAWGTPLAPWTYEELDARAMLTDVMRLGHFPALDAAALGVVAGLVQAAVTARLARLVAAAGRPS